MIFVYFSRSCADGCTVVLSLRSWLWLVVGYQGRLAWWEQSLTSITGNMALNGGYYKRGVGDPISVTLPLLATSII
jgi:hypothetical protein